MFAIVMAGGVGTRLWPLSRRKSPKQLLALTGETDYPMALFRRDRPALTKSWSREVEASR